LEFGELATDLLREPNSLKRIEALADEVVRKGRLSGYEAVRILERTWGNPLPERARPATEHYATPTGSSPENALEFCGRLCRLAYEILNEVHEVDWRVESVKKTVLQNILQLEEIHPTGGGP
jgi:hypothetical protein